MVVAGEGKGMAVAEEAAEGEAEPPVVAVEPAVPGAADGVGNKGKVVADEPKAEGSMQPCRPSVGWECYCPNLLHFRFINFVVEFKHSVL